VAALYVTSLAEGGGKTAVCAGLARHLADDGKKVGFLKPITQGDVDSDALLMKDLLSLDEAPVKMCPVVGDAGESPAVVKQAYGQVSEGKDVVIVEGASEANEVARDMAELLDARVIIVGGPIELTQNTAVVCELFGERLLGVVVNKVPASQVEQVRGQVTTAFGEAGIEVLAVLPEDRALFGLTVGELAACANGEMLNSADKSGEVVENVMLGAMTVDTGPLYYGRKDNKVAVLRSERADMQLAVLQTPTRCLLLSGQVRPLPQIMGEAEHKGVPIVMAQDDVATIVSSIEEAMSVTRFSAGKLPRLTEIMEEQLDFPTVYKGLGLVA